MKQKQKQSKLISNMHIHTWRWRGWRLNQDRFLFLRSTAIFPLSRFSYFFNQTNTIFTLFSNLNITTWFSCFSSVGLIDSCFSPSPYSGRFRRLVGGNFEAVGEAGLGSSSERRRRWWRRRRWRWRWRRWLDWLNGDDWKWWSWRWCWWIHEVRKRWRFESLGNEWLLEMELSESGGASIWITIFWVY